MSLSTQPRFSGIFILTATLSFVAGIVGALVGTVLFSSTPTTDGDTLSLLRSRRGGIVQQEVDIDAAKNAFRAAVEFVPTSVVPDVGAPIEEKDVLASGVVLTTDGWILTMRSAIPDKYLKDLKLMSAVVGNRAYVVTEMSSDPYSGVLFLHVDAKDLPIVDFAYDAALSPGAFLHIPTLDREGIHSVRLVGLGVNAATSVQSSEVLQSVLRLDGVVFSKGGSSLYGSMLVTNDGRIAGVLAESEDGEVYGVPFGAISKEISTVLRGESISRPYLGVFALPLDRAVSVEDGGVVRGVRMVSGPRGEVAVGVRSPADVGGLKAGDVVLTVNGEAVTLARPLADILADYSAGSVIIMGVLHEGVAKELQVTLGVQPVR